VPDYVQGGMFGGLNFAPLDFNPTFGSKPAALPGATINDSTSLTGATILGANPSTDNHTTTTSDTTVSPGQNKFNGWMNYLSGQATGLPSGNTGGTNPGATDSPAGQAVLSALGGSIETIMVFILGAVFVAAGLYMFAKK
jgi:hypothetical protein